MRYDAAPTFLNPQIAREMRSNMGTHFNSVKTVSAASYSVIPDDSGKLILCTSGGSNQTVSMPAASGFPNGFTVAIRKNDTGTGSVIVQGSSTLAILYQEFDEVVLMSDGANWVYISRPNVDKRAVATMPTGTATMQINPRANGRYRQVNIPLNGFSGTANEAITIEFLAPFSVGDVYYLWLPRTNEAATKTLNFLASGMTIRRSWGAGVFTFPQNQRHRFICEVVAANEIHIVQLRIQP